eukprot:UN24427
MHVKQFQIPSQKKRDDCIHLTRAISSISIIDVVMVPLNCELICREIVPIIKRVFQNANSLPSTSTFSIVNLS